MDFSTFSVLYKWLRVFNQHCEVEDGTCLLSKGDFAKLLEDINFDEDFYKIIEDMKIAKENHLSNADSSAGDFTEEDYLISFLQVVGSEDPVEIIFEMIDSANQG